MSATSLNEDAPVEHRLERISEALDILVTLNATGTHPILVMNEVLQFIAKWHYDLPLDQATTLATELYTKFMNILSAHVAKTRPETSLEHFKKWMSEHCQELFIKDMLTVLTAKNNLSV